MQEDVLSSFEPRVFIIDEKPERLQPRVLLALVLILVAFAAFGLGRLSKIKGLQEPVVIEQEAFAASVGGSTETSGSDVLGSSIAGGLVASRNGTRYHYPWCSGAARISGSS